MPYQNNGTCPADQTRSGSDTPDGSSLKNRTNQDRPTPEEFNSVIGSLKMMTKIAVACLIIGALVHFKIFYGTIPTVISSLLLVVILVMSLPLTDRAKSIFARTAHPSYAHMVGGIHTKCLILLIAEIISVLAGITGNSIALSMLPELNEEEDLIPLLLIVPILPFISLIIAILQFYCFFRLFTVTNAIIRLSSGANIPYKPGSKAVVWSIILGILMVVSVHFSLHIGPLNLNL